MKVIPDWLSLKNASSVFLITQGFKIQMFMNISFIKIRAWGNGLERKKRILPNHLKDAN